jgi:imidazolonepropionase-like amidohydrolase
MMGLNQRCKELGDECLHFILCRIGGRARVRHYWVLYTLEEIRAITDEAHRMERRCACHAHGTQGIKDAIIGGADTIEHGTYLDDEGVKLMREHGTYYVPTFTIHYNIVNMGEELKVPPYTIQKIGDTWEHSVPSVQRARRAGVKIACGTDSGGTWAPCGENARELELLVKFGGMTPMEAITAATKVSAEAIGRDKDLGTIGPNKLADIILVEGDPLNDIKLLQDASNVKMVIKGGKIEVNRGV